MVLELELELLLVARVLSMASVVAVAALAVAAAANNGGGGGGGVSRGGGGDGGNVGAGVLTYTSPPFKKLLKSLFLAGNTRRSALVARTYTSRCVIIVVCHKAHV